MDFARENGTEHSQGPLGGIPSVTTHLKEKKDGDKKLPGAVVNRKTAS